jgi:hypothetical protein
MNPPILPHLPRGPTADLCICVLGAELNSFISYYEPAYYNTSHVAQQLINTRKKRSVNYLSDNTLNINFKAHER